MRRLPKKNPNKGRKKDAMFRTSYSKNPTRRFNDYLCPKCGADRWKYESVWGGIYGKGFVCSGCKTFFKKEEAVRITTRLKKVGVAKTATVFVPKEATIPEEKLTEIYSSLLSQRFSIALHDERVKEKTKNIQATIIISSWIAILISIGVISLLLI